MVELISNYTFRDLIHTKLDGINDQAFLLWVLHADKIPPHIGISYKGKFYSLKANGKDEGVCVSSIKNVIARKEITTLTIELDMRFMKEDIEKSFLKFNQTIPHQITCLDPIKLIVGNRQAVKLIDLLTFLEINNGIVQVKGLYTDKFEGIVNYDENEIHARLEKLQHVR